MTRARHYAAYQMSQTKSSMTSEKRRVEVRACTWIASAACAIAVVGCASAERNFGGVTDERSDASSTGDEAGVVDAPTSSPDGGEPGASTLESTPLDPGDSAETTRDNGSSGAEFGSDGGSGGSTRDPASTATSGSTEPPGGDHSGSNTQDGEYYEDSAYPYSCVALCQGSFNGDLSLASSKVGGLKIVVPQSQCPSECATEVVEIAAGGEHTCARRGDGAVKCWGNGLQGRLGLGDVLWHGSGPGEMGEALPAVDLGSGRLARAISAGHDHTCALLDDWSIKCWGANGEGQLGQGDTADRGDAANEMGDALTPIDLGEGRTALAVSAGHRDTCAVLDSGEVKCWGQDELGKLGLGNSGSLGDAAGEMGDALPIVNLGTGVYAVDVEATYQHTCALLASGEIKCWGYENAGRLGRGGNDATGDDTAEMGDQLPVVNLGSERIAASLGLGYLHSCAVLSDTHAVKCWGYGQGGRLGLGDAMSRGEAEQMGDALPEIALGDGAAVRTIAPGDEHTCALLSNGAVKCWGVGTWGRLGTGDESDRGDEPNEMGAELPRVELGSGRIARALASGYRHSCALLDDGSVRCWGEADAGRLGLGDQDDRGDDAGEMGDALPAVSLW